jgi:RNA polymerase sigma-70 factor (ECF subfamily)
LSPGDDSLAIAGTVAHSIYVPPVTLRVVPNEPSSDVAPSQTAREPLRPGQAPGTNAPEKIPSVREVVEQHSAHVWRTLYYCGVAPSDLKDACQEVFLVISRKLGEFEGRSSLRTWVYQICVRVAAGYRRSARLRYERVVAEPPEVAVHETQQDELEERRTRERLVAILEKIDEDQREVFVLYEIEERPMAEIASALGCPLRTAYSRLEAARKEIMRAWRRAEAPWVRS